ncbi:MAG: hypothetical protein INF75_00270 [Roseomonas sp.]|nr:hypothetical protein [Roseomonas sp.]MCA3327686.1 hypothetical protein [Roseomonas sp.]MCA3330695.1 hypothetical protein [Roseomonas sp.]MCA3334184.1 hypothetical protein [Roseomonas sp.]MCA3346726.1 hypothetical protein [Roseomonas sp.]
MVFDIFSKRAWRQGGAANDVYQYEEIPDRVRRQLVLLFEREIGTPTYDEDDDASEFYAAVCRILREEYGAFHLLDLVGMPEGHRSHSRPGFYELSNFFLREKNIHSCLDVIEICARHFSNLRKNGACATLNTRLREGGVGFQVESGLAIRVDHQLVHSEVIKPTLNLLSATGFEGANDEFLHAHKKYRNGDYKGALLEGAKAFESVLKIILRKHGQDVTERDTASALLNKFFGLNLLPIYLEKQLNDLKSLLQGGAPNVRNKEAAHGQGEEVREVPEYLAAYGLHQTASAILLIVKAYEAAR